MQTRVILNLSHPHVWLLSSKEHKVLNKSKMMISNGQFLKNVIPCMLSFVKVLLRKSHIERSICQLHPSKQTTSNVYKSMFTYEASENTDGCIDHILAKRERICSHTIGALKNTIQLWYRFVRYASLKYGSSLHTKSRISWGHASRS